MTPSPTPAIRGLVATGVSLLFSSAATAQFYSGALDPASDGIVPAWNGDAHFFIADPGCTGPGLNFPGASGCGPASVTSATVFLYGNTLGALPGLPHGSGALDTLTLAFPPEPIVSVLFGPGKQLLGVDTDPMQLTGNVHYPGTFWLDYDINNTNFLQLRPELDVQPAAFIPTAFLLYDPTCSVDCSPFGVHRSPPAVVTFCTGQQACTAAVPEPGALELVFGATIAAFIARRRKNKT